MDTKKSQSHCSREFRLIGESHRVVIAPWCGILHQGPADPKPEIFHICEYSRHRRRQETQGHLTQAAAASVPPLTMPVAAENCTARSLSQSSGVKQNIGSVLQITGLCGPEALGTASS